MYTWKITIDSTSSFPYRGNVYFNGARLGDRFSGVDFLTSTLWGANLRIKRIIRMHKKSLKQSTWTGESE